MPKSCALFVLVLLLVGCRPSPAVPQAAAVAPATDGDHMVSVDTPDPPPPRKPTRDQRAWPPAELSLGRAWVSCATDYSAMDGDGASLEAMDRVTLEAAMRPCQQAGLLRVRYAGKIDPGFAELMARLAVVADALGLQRRILDLDSSGGQVEAAIRAGDAIGAARWTIWVREGSICHSACVFVLAAGDNRLVAGNVGIHRMMRISSRASSRAELSAELQQVYGNVKAYLERNGVAVAVADLMMTVPNRSVRLLSAEELRQYGLEGTNAVQDDLDRIRLMRECGDDFVRRKDAFLVAFDQQCKRAGEELETVNACGQALKQRFGFPDEVCPQQSPLAENDATVLMPSLSKPPPASDAAAPANRPQGDPARPVAPTAARS